MRPFYEQHHFDHRPISKVGARHIPEYVTDFVRWYDENLAVTPHVADAKTHMTAFSKMDAKKFRQTSRRGIGSYAKSLGHWPDFLRAKSFMAMTTMHALLMPMPRHQPADKLLVGDWIQDHLKDQVTTAEVVRIFDKGDDVNFDGIEPGVYFLKANHGSHYNCRVVIPCSDEEMTHLRSEANRWLASNYGEFSCQWWYQYIDRKVFLEKSLLAADEPGPLEDYRFHIINGKAAFLQLDVGLGTENRHNPIYDENLNWLPYEFVRDNLHEVELPEIAGRAQKLAIELGSQFQYCRVDLYVKNEELILGELTFLPNAGRRPVNSPELDEYICSFWQDKMPEVTRIE